MSFKEIKPEELNFNPFTRIGSDWMLLTAGTEDKFNTMTASWGGAGVFWGKPAVTCYIRPQRYTKEFIDKEELFSVSFLKDGHRDALKLCGSVSGRFHVSFVFILNYHFKLKRAVFTCWLLPPIITSKSPGSAT